MLHVLGSNKKGRLCRKDSTMTGIEKSEYLDVMKGTCSEQWDFHCIQETLKTLDLTNVTPTAAGDNHDGTRVHPKQVN